MKETSPWQNADERQLLHQAKGGSAEAFGELYARHVESVFRFVFAHLDNRLDAEDLTEEVFLRVWRALPRYRERGVPFIAFVLRIARNALIDHYRRASTAGGQVSLESVTLHDGAPGPAQAVTSGMEREQLRKVLRQLPEMYRTVLVLRFLNGHSPEETAQVMGRNPGAIRVLQHRALAAARKLMEKLGDE